MAAALIALPGLALAQAGGACGWRGGAMADPAATHNCLAGRYKPPKSKAPDPPKAPPTPPSGVPATPGR